MSSNISESPRESFIVRLWRKNEYDTKWQGQVQHVRTGKTTYIQGLADLERYFSTYLEESPQEKNSLK